MDIASATDVPQCHSPTPDDVQHQSSGSESLSPTPNAAQLDPTHTARAPSRPLRYPTSAPSPTNVSHAPSLDPRSRGDDAVLSVRAPGRRRRRARAGQPRREREEILREGCCERGEDRFGRAPTSALAR
ncbi:hypothetical protein AURDEDRAFT_160867 [Auricularia subglabra TFB-10046 SS5]|nr:hypothetical protein AURDEDRAFT_160867 [Auricularia subglabra TFB-10046 SS5]